MSFRDIAKIIKSIWEKCKITTS